MKSLDDVIFESGVKRLGYSLGMSAQEARVICDDVRLWLRDAQYDAVVLLEKVIREMDAGWRPDVTTLPLWIGDRLSDLNAAHGILIALHKKERPESFVFEATPELRWKNSDSGLRIEQKWKRVSGEGFEWRHLPWVEEGEK